MLGSETLFELVRLNKVQKHLYTDAGLKFTVQKTGDSLDFVGWWGCLTEFIALNAERKENGMDGNVNASNEALFKMFKVDI